MKDNENCFFMSLCVSNPTRKLSKLIGFPNHKTLCRKLGKFNTNEAYRYSKNQDLGKNVA